MQTYVLLSVSVVFASVDDGKQYEKSGRHLFISFRGTKDEGPGKRRRGQA